MSPKNGDSQPAFDIVNTFVHKIKAENEVRRLDGFERVFLKTNSFAKKSGQTKVGLPSIEEEKEIIDSFQKQLCEGRKRSLAAASNTTYFSTVSKMASPWASSSQSLLRQSGGVRDGAGCLKRGEEVGAFVREEHSYSKIDTICEKGRECPANNSFSNPSSKLTADIAESSTEEERLLMIRGEADLRLATMRREKAAIDLVLGEQHADGFDEDEDDLRGWAEWLRQEVRAIFEESEFGDQENTSLGVPRIIGFSSFDQTMQEKVSIEEEKEHMFERSEKQLAALEAPGCSSVESADADIGNEQPKREGKREPNNQFAAHGDEVRSNVPEAVDIMTTLRDRTVKDRENVDDNLDIETRLLDDANIRLMEQNIQKDDAFINQQKKIVERLNRRESSESVSSMEKKSDNGFLPVEKLVSLFKDTRQKIPPPKKRKRNQNSDELKKSNQRRKKLKEEVPAGKPAFIEHKSNKIVVAEEVSQQQKEEQNRLTKMKKGTKQTKEEIVMNLVGDKSNEDKVGPVLLEHNNSIQSIDKDNHHIDGKNRKLDTGSRRRRKKIEAKKAARQTDTKESPSVIKVEDTEKKSKEIKGKEGKFDNRKLLHSTDKHLASTNKAAEKEKETKNIELITLDEDEDDEEEEEEEDAEMNEIIEEYLAVHNEKEQMLKENEEALLVIDEINLEQDKSRRILGESQLSFQSEARVSENAAKTKRYKKGKRDNNKRRSKSGDPKLKPKKENTAETKPLLEIKRKREKVVKTLRREAKMLERKKKKSMTLEGGAKKKEKAEKTIKGRMAKVRLHLVPSISDTFP